MPRRGRSLEVSSVHGSPWTETRDPRKRHRSSGLSWPRRLWAGGVERHEPAPVTTPVVCDSLADFSPAFDSIPWTVDAHFGGLGHQQPYPASDMDSGAGPSFFLGGSPPDIPLSSIASPHPIFVDQLPTLPVAPNKVLPSRLPRGQAAARGVAVSHALGGFLPRPSRLPLGPFLDNSVFRPRLHYSHYPDSELRLSPRKHQEESLSCCTAFVRA